MSQSISFFFYKLKVTRINMRIMDFEISDTEYTKLLNFVIQFTQNNMGKWNSLDFNTRRAFILDFLNKA